ncbi:hypothetical protein, partial [Gallibacterium salpingitidis]
NAGNKPLPWQFTYPVRLSANTLYADVIRLEGAGSHSEIVVYRGLSYMNWIDKNYVNETGSGDLVGLLVIGF